MSNLFKNAPEWAEYAAMDKDGSWNWFSKKPYPDDEYKEWMYPSGDAGYYHEGFVTDGFIFANDWTKTLHERNFDERSIEDRVSELEEKVSDFLSSSVLDVRKSGRRDRSTEISGVKNLPKQGDVVTAWLENDDANGAYTEVYVVDTTHGGAIIFENPLFDGVLDMIYCWRA